MNRRAFIEALGAVCLQVKSRLLHGASLLNGEVSPVAEAPNLIPVPSSVKGVERPVLNLAGEWHVNMDPPPEFWRSPLDSNVVDQDRSAK